MFEEEEEVEETVAEKTHRLQERILELNSLIHAVEIPLVASGYLAKASHISGIPQNGIRINNQLSFRGLQKSQEYYRAINDANQTSAFDFEGFRAMKSLTSPWGIVHGTETKKWFVGVFLGVFYCRIINVFGIAGSLGRCLWQMQGCPRQRRAVLASRGS